jgi:hypothetical protein
MQFCEFQQLDYPHMMEETDRAVCLMGRSDEDYLIMLYQLDGFYIEVFFHRNLQEVTKFRAFDDTAMLEPYLENIELPFAA